jgi:hypothetical protein
MEENLFKEGSYVHLCTTNTHQGLFMDPVNMALFGKGVFKYN